MSEYLNFLELFSSTKPISRDFVARKMNISKRKVQLLIDDLNYQMKPFANIMSKSGTGNGYCLCVFDKSLYDKYLAKLKDESVSVETHVLNEMLTTNGYFKIDELVGKYYLSEKRNREVINNVKNTLDSYNLKLINRPHYGSFVEGSEKSKRLCFANEIYKTDYFVYHRESIISNYIRKQDQIKSSLSNIFSKYDYKIQDYTLDNLVIHVIVMMYRIESNFPMNPLLLQAYDEKLEKITDEISCYILSEFNLTINGEEHNWLVIHLMIKEDNSNKSVAVLPEDICETVLEMLGTIDDRYGTKLHLDFKLCMSMSLHFCALLPRIFHRMYVTNPILDDIKRNYLYEYELACEGAKYINKKYNCYLTDDEIGYFALDIRLSFKNKSVLNKSKVLLICSTGRGSSEILKLNFMNCFGDYISKIDVSSLNEIKTFDLDTYDFIFTTIPFVATTKTPILLISTFLHSDEINRLEGVFNKQNELIEHFDSRLFMANIKAETKEEVIHQMVGHIRKYYNISTDFEERVLEREKMASTALGNNFAFPHPTSFEENDTFICVASLKKPVLWNKKKVKLVIMPSIAKDLKESESFYSAFIKIINDQENIDLLIENTSIETIERIMKKA